MSGDLKKFFNKFWYIVWKDDSLKGWFLSIIFIFIVIKFIFFPILSLAVGFSPTDIKNGAALPLAIVESCSMYHQGNLLSNFENWWENHELKYSAEIINKLDFQDFIFKNGFNKGDILFIIEAKPEKLKVGEVIIFNGGTNTPIIHRIIKIKKESEGYIFSTIGDNNNGQLSFEKNIQEEQLVGKAVFKIAPYIGWGKLIFYEYTKPKSERGLCQEN